jgi:hypothetical protein
VFRGGRCRPRSSIPTAAVDLLPPLGDRWAGFTRDDPGTDDGSADPVRAWLRAAIDDRETQHEGLVVERFLKDLRPAAGKPLFSWLHVQLPHPPWRYLPTGQTYATGQDTPGYRDFGWDADQYLATEVLQRSLLQTVYADALLGRMIDHLQGSGLWDDMVFAVIADHGATWQEGATRRDLDGPQSAGVLGVPLFVHYPGQQQGKIDDRNAEVIDLLPTIADAAGIVVPWDTHGTSLRDDPRRATKRVFDGDRDREVDYSFDGSRRLAQRIVGLFNRDLYGFGPDRGLIGRSTSVFAISAAPSPISASYDATVFRDIDVDGRVLPAFFRATLSEGRAAGSRVVATLNGRVAGVGQTYVEDGESQVAMMLSPAYMRNGRNDFGLYFLIDARRPTLMRVPRS